MCTWIGCGRILTLEYRKPVALPPFAPGGYGTPSPLQYVRRQPSRCCRGPGCPSRCGRGGAPGEWNLEPNCPPSDSFPTLSGYSAVSHSGEIPRARAVCCLLTAPTVQAHCAKVGAHLVSGLKALARKHDIIGDVRGSGLMLGVELVTDRGTKAPATAQTAHALQRMAELGALVGKVIFFPLSLSRAYNFCVGDRGTIEFSPFFYKEPASLKSPFILLLSKKTFLRPLARSKGGLHGNAFRIKPPMCFSIADADALIGIMDRALGEL